MSNNHSPKEQGGKSWWNYDSFDEEKYSKLLDRHASQYRLKDPVNEEAENPS